MVANCTKSSVRRRLFPGGDDDDGGDTRRRRGGGGVREAVSRRLARDCRRFEQKWNFDVRSGKPLDGPFRWSLVTEGEDVPGFYRKAYPPKRDYLARNGAVRRRRTRQDLEISTKRGHLYTNSTTDSSTTTTTTTTTTDTTTTTTTTTTSSSSSSSDSARDGRCGSSVETECSSSSTSILTDSLTQTRIPDFYKSRKPFFSSQETTLDEKNPKRPRIE